MRVPGGEQRRSSFATFLNNYTVEPLHYLSFSSISRSAIMCWSYMSDVLEDTWLLQNLAVFASFLLTGVLIALLARFNNMPILQWNGISLNAIVALIATILKGLIALTMSDCLEQAKWIWLSWQERSLSDFAVIDQGSRGPLESVKML